MAKHNLEITFRGLFLFVPDPTRRFLHVVLPRTAMLGNEHEHHPLWARLPAEPKDYKPFNDYFVDLRDVPSSGSMAALPSSCANISPHNDCSITPDHVGDSVHRNAIASLRLSLPTDIAPGPATLWELAGKNAYLTNEMKCIWPDLEISELRVTFWKRDGTSQVLELEPEGDGWELEFTHVPEEDPFIPKGEFAHHFRSYYTICGSTRSAPLPVLKQTPPAPAVSTFTCMIAQAPLGT